MDWKTTLAHVGGAFIGWSAMDWLLKSPTFDPKMLIAGAIFSAISLVLYLRAA